MDVQNAGKRPSSSELLGHRLVVQHLAHKNRVLKGEVELVKKKEEEDRNVMNELKEESEGKEEESAQKEEDHKKSINHLKEENERNKEESEHKEKKFGEMIMLQEENNQKNDELKKLVQELAAEGIAVDFMYTGLFSLFFHFSFFILSFFHFFFTFFSPFPYFFSLPFFLDKTNETSDSSIDINVVYVGL
jgi:cation transport ATPase